MSPVKNHLITKSLMFALICAGPNALAAAKATTPATPPTCGGGGSTVGTTPNPLRPVVITDVGTKAFTLPNGGAANLSIDLQTMVSTSVANTSSFQPANINTQDPCNSHLEIRAAVTTLQLNVGGVNISFGYTPTGTVPVVSNVTGKLGVTIGNIAMDFSVVSCTAGNCITVAASTANHNTTGVTGSFEIDFGQVKTGSDLLYNTPVGDALRTIMASGLSQLASSPALSQLPWRAKVNEYIASSGMVNFDAGTQSRIAANQSFEIYAPTTSASGGSCNVYDMVAIMHTTSVNTVSSVAAVDRLNGSRGVQAGDIVMIHVAK